MENKHLEGKYKFIYSFTDELHTNITDIYEALMDDEKEDAVKIINLVMSKLKDLKNSIYEN